MNLTGRLLGLLLTLALPLTAAESAGDRAASRTKGIRLAPVSVPDRNTLHPGHLVNPESLEGQLIVTDGGIIAADNRPPDLNISEGRFARLFVVERASP